MKKLLLVPALLLSTVTNASFFSDLLQEAKNTVCAHKYICAATAATVVAATVVKSAYGYAKAWQAVDTYQPGTTEESEMFEFIQLPTPATKTPRKKRQVFVEEAPIIEQKQPTPMAAKESMELFVAQRKAAMEVTAQEVPAVVPTPKARPVVAPKPKIVVPTTPAQPAIEKEQTPEERAAITARMARLAQSGARSTGVLTRGEQLPAPLLIAITRPEVQTQRLEHASQVRQQALQATTMNEAQERARQIAKRNAARFKQSNA